MKKIAAVAAAAVLAFALAGCGSQPASSSSASAESMPVSDASASSTSVSAQTVSTVKWTDVASAEEAAKGAGIAKFGVMDKITLDSADYANPKFAYADGVAQATYENGAIDLIVRKADGKHTAPLTDRDKTSFAESWSKSYEGLDVTCYGSAKGAATVVTWVDGTQEYGITYQGLGGEEVTLDSDEVALLVKGFKEVNTTQAQPKEETTEENQENTGEISDSGADVLNGMDPEAIIWNAGLGEVIGTTQVQLNDGKWYWEVTCRGANGDEHTYVIDVNGSITDVTGGNDNEGEGEISDSGADVLDGMDPEAIIQQNGLGEYTGATQVQLGDGSWAWQVTTNDTEGDQHTFLIDVSGNVSEI